MGYSAVTKGYVLYSLVTHTFFMSRDVLFKENIFPLQTKNLSTPRFVGFSTDPFIPVSQDSVQVDEILPHSSIEADHNATVDHLPATPLPFDAYDIIPVVIDMPIEIFPRRSTRTKKQLI